MFGPEYEIYDYFVRQEFQMRGSPHMHGIFYARNTKDKEPSPKYREGDKESERKCIEIIDKYITCSRVVPVHLESYLQYQIHCHANTCRKKVGKQKCRFGFPRPPLPETMILQPLPEEASHKTKETAKSNWQKVEDYLNKLGRNPESFLSFQDFLKDLNLTAENYITGKFF